mmetsp:Transcript_41686/g.74774  ORF Transcript_41686/g.74774 Transcript_41686/m.74774 type:complete len:384 (+) Transcript_41686:34-1185(+)
MVSAFSGATTLILPSLGFILDDGGRIAEVTCAGVSSPVGIGGPANFAARGTLPSVKSSRKTIATVASSRSSSKTSKGAGAKKSGGDVQNLGVPHSARLHTVLVEGDSVSLQASGANEEEQINTCLKVAAEAETMRMKHAFQHMCPYFAALKPGSLVLEVGSRSGDMTLMFAERFPDLYIQPTEGTGEASPGLFMLLQERLSMLKRDPQPRRRTKKRAMENVPRSRVLPPRFLDGGQQKGWRTRITSQDISCIFCVNVLHYVAPHGLQHFMQGCSDNLPVGGSLLICGPFFNNGEAVENLLVYDGALRSFVSTSERKLQWGCHDVAHLKALGAQAGLTFAAQVETEGVGGHSWILVVFSKERRVLPDPSRRRSSTAQSSTFMSG